MTRRRAHAATLFAFFSLAGSVAQAAYIVIDDSDIANITITAGDFEGGFSVNGSLLTTGLGNSGSITLADGGYTIDGSWIDLGSPTGRVDILFALTGDPTRVTSGMEFAWTTDGFSGTLAGSFGGFTGLPYFTTGVPTFSQETSGTQGGAAPFLSVSFTPEGQVPEPGTMLLLGGALPLLYVASRRRKA